MSAPWLDLPEEVLIKILGHLNVRSLLNASETCTRFNDVMGKSKKLMKMIRLKLEMPVKFSRRFQQEQQNLKCHRQMKDLKENLLMSQRLYQNSGLSNLGECREIIDCSEAYEDIQLVILETPNIVMEICEIFQIFCENIIDFKMQKCSIVNEEFMSIMDVFKNVQECSIENTKIYGYYEDCTLKLPKLERILLQHFSFSRITNFFLSSDNLKSCKMFYGNAFILKNLLLRQKHLKVLHLNCFDIYGDCWDVFGQDVFSSAEFSLESLSLDCGRYVNLDHAESFYKKHINLKDIFLKLEECDQGLNFRYNDILKQIFSLNHNLSTINLEIKFKMEDATFLDGICLPKVTSLSFRSSEENDAFFAALIKMCPKIKKLAFRSNKEYIDIAAVNTLVDLESLTIDSEGELMQDIICAGRLLNFSLMNNGDDEDTKIFLRNHQSIEHLIISNKPNEPQKIVSRVLCKYIVKYLPNLRSFEFDELESPSETLQMLLTLKNLCSLKSTSIEWINEVKDLCTSAGIEIQLRERDSFKYNVEYYKTRYYL